MILSAIYLPRKWNHDCLLMEIKPWKDILECELFFQWTGYSSRQSHSSHYWLQRGYGRCWTNFIFTLSESSFSAGFLQLLHPSTDISKFLCSFRFYWTLVCWRRNLHDACIQRHMYATVTSWLHHHLPWTRSQTLPRTLPRKRSIGTVNKVHPGQSVHCSTKACPWIVGLSLTSRSR